MTTNGLADFHAKEAAGLIRVPKATRDQVNGYLGTVKEAARWIGEINYTANHRDDPPFRDSEASQALARKARIGRAKAKTQRIAPMIVPRPVCLGGHDLRPVDSQCGGKRANAMRCTLCRLTSTKPTFCRTSCKGSATARWAEATKQMADNGVQDGGGHARLISGDIIWCGICGAYADLKVSGLTEKCTKKHIGPWNGGGKRGQLNSLRRNRHPRTKIQLPPPVPESTMALDAVAGASQDQLADATTRRARYAAKDKAVARANASMPLAALTDEKRRWIANKRAAAIRRAAGKRTQLEQPMPASTGGTVRAEWSQRIRESYLGKKARTGDMRASISMDGTPPELKRQWPDSPEYNADGSDSEAAAQQATPQQHRDGTSERLAKSSKVSNFQGAGRRHWEQDVTMPSDGQEPEETTRPPYDGGAGSSDDQADEGENDFSRCNDCGASQKWHHCWQCDAVQCYVCTPHHQCGHCTAMICLWCTNDHGESCEERPGADDRPVSSRHDNLDAASYDEPPIIDSSSDDDHESKVFWANFGSNESVQEQRQEQEQEQDSPCEELPRCYAKHVAKAESPSLLRGVTPWSATGGGVGTPPRGGSKQDQDQQQDQDQEQDQEQDQQQQQQQQQRQQLQRRFGPIDDDTANDLKDMLQL